MRRLGLLTRSGGLVVGVLMLGLIVWSTQATASVWHQDGVMAWEYIADMNMPLLLISSLWGSLLGSRYWGPRSQGYTLTSPRPMTRLISIWLIANGVQATAVLLGSIALVVRLTEASVHVPFSPIVVHLIAALAASLTLGMVFGAKTPDPLIASALALTATFLLYAFAPFLVGHRLLDVGGSPIPMIDLQRSLPYALWVGGGLTLAAILTLVWLSRRRAPSHARLLAAGSAILCLGVFFIAPPADVLESTQSPRACFPLVLGKEMCFPGAYADLASSAVPQAKRLLERAEESGIDALLLPTRFILGNPSGPTSHGDSVTFVPIAPGGKPGALSVDTVAGMLVTPSWCSEMYDVDAPVALLERSDALRGWLLWRAGYITDAQASFSIGQFTPASLSAADVNKELAHSRACED